MSDVSKTNAEMIAEAQQHYSEMNGLNSRAAEVMMELVAALEAKTGVRVDMSSAVGVEAQLAAARVPVQGEPNDESDFRLARSRGYAALVAERDFTGHMDEGRRTAYYEGFKLGRKHPQGEPSDDREARKIAEKLFPLDGSEPGTVFEARRRAVEAIRLSRATVPDAASAAIERVRAICAEAKAARARNVATSKRLGYASSSTSERVPGMDDVLAALDGAPEPAEPEWEYGYELIEPDDRNVFDRGYPFESPALAYRAAKNHITSEDSDGLPRLQYALVRRREAGPWLPVEGESE